MRTLIHPVLVCAAALFAGAAAALSAPEASRAATALADIVIADDRVYLGDLFDGLSPEQADIPIARSPAPGREVVLDRRWVARLIQAHGLEMDGPLNALPAMTVRRQSTRVSGEVIVDAVRSALMEQDASAAGDRLDVSMDRLPEDIHLPGDAAVEIEISDLSLDRSSGRFTGRATIMASGASHAAIPISGRARSMISVPVLARRVGNRTVISADDLDWVEVDAMRVDGAVIHDPAEIVGMTARRGIAPNTPIRGHDLAAPIIVSRGDRVTMIVRHGSLSLAAQGRALEDGAEGQAIRVMNVDSNQTVEGVVEASGQVRVISGSGAS